MPWFILSLYTALTHSFVIDSLVFTPKICVLRDRLVESSAKEKKKKEKEREKNKKSCKQMESIEEKHFEMWQTFYCQTI